jgi:hypothetical protein
MLLHIHAHVIASTLDITKWHITRPCAAVSKATTTIVFYEGQHEIATVGIDQHADTYRTRQRNFAIPVVLSTNDLRPMTWHLAMVEANIPDVRDLGATVHT